MGDAPLPASSSPIAAAGPRGRTEEDEEEDAIMVPRLGEGEWEVEGEEPTLESPVAVLAPPSSSLERGGSPVTPDDDDDDDEEVSGFPCETRSHSCTNFLRYIDANASTLHSVEPSIEAEGEDPAPPTPGPSLAPSSSTLGVETEEGPPSPSARDASRGSREGGPIDVLRWRVGSAHGHEEDHMAEQKSINASRMEHSISVWRGIKISSSPSK